MSRHVTNLEIAFAKKHLQGPSLVAGTNLQLYLEKLSPFE